MSTKSVMEIAALDWAVMHGTFARGTSTWGHFNLLSDDAIHAAVLAGDITSDQGLFLLRRARQSTVFPWTVAAPG